MLTETLSKIKGEILRGEWLLGLTVFLLVTLAFGLGWVGASRTAGRAPIVINCPLDNQ